MKYDKPRAGEWVYPTRKGYKLACCDCGLVHRMDFQLLKQSKRSKILFRVFRDQRATGQVRRHMKEKEKD